MNPNQSLVTAINKVRELVVSSNNVYTDYNDWNTSWTRDSNINQNN